MDPAFSPDGMYRVDLHEFEMKMSHWVANPVVTHVPSGQVLLDLTDTMWDAAATFEHDGCLTLDLREYPGTTPGFRATIDFETLEVRTRPFPAPPHETPATMTLEQLLKSLAPSRALPLEVRARRRAINRKATLDASATLAEDRAAAQRAERAREDEIARQCAEAERLAELDRQSSAQRMRREADDAYQLVLARAGLGDAAIATPGTPTHAPQSAASNRGGRSQAIAGFALTLGSIGAALLVLWGIAWLVAEHSPMRAAPAWAAWGVGSLVAAAIVIGVPMALLIWGFRNFRG